MSIIPWIRKWGKSGRVANTCAGHPSEIERIRHEVRHGTIGAQMCCREAERKILEALRESKKMLGGNREVQAQAGLILQALQNIRKMSGHLERVELAVKKAEIKPE